MLLLERHRIILNLLQLQGIVKISELVQATNSSAATIRRDLKNLEKEQLLKRVHGGAASLQGKGVEPSVRENATVHLEEKKQIAFLAASLIREGDCIYLDAGTTTFEMIPYIKQNVTVVTNGLMHLESLYKYDLNAYLLGGRIKSLTKVLIGSEALKQLQAYRFDKCFIGTNGVHTALGYTTVDPEEASLKKLALQLSEQRFVVADHTKCEKANFIQFAALQEASLIIDQMEQKMENIITRRTSVIKVVKE